jgi:hypothetical protein
VKKRIDSYTVARPAAAREWAVLTVRTADGHQENYVARKCASSSEAERLAVTLNAVRA